MKKAIAFVLGLWLCAAALTAAGGSAGDPLISRSYLEGEFLQSLEEAVKDKLGAAGQTVPAAPETEEYTAGECMLNEGDLLRGAAGMSVTLLGGEVRLDASGCAVVDVTEVSGGQILKANHRYIVAENGAADFAAVSPAAVLSCEGGSELTQGPGADYFAIAGALQELGLFRGTGSGFGRGFDLHLAPSRGEGMVMFLRLLGEEEQALAWEGRHPFTDVPGWLDRYVAWAYAQGYANGVAADRFGCELKMSAAEYEEFLLRALGYSAAGVDDYRTSLERALERGALSEGECAMLREQGFLRAHVAYLSYYALDVPVNGGETLARKLTAAGVMTSKQLDAARKQVNSLRV